MISKKYLTTGEALDAEMEAAVQSGMRYGLALVAAYNFIRPVCLNATEAWVAAYALAGTPYQAVDHGVSSACGGHTHGECETNSCQCCCHGE